MSLKIFIYIIVLLSSITVSVSGEGLINNPESIIFDTLNERFLISNPIDNNIVQLDINDNQSYFATNIEHPLGLIIVDQFLYCAGNGKLFVFDLTTDSLVNSPTVSGFPGMFNGLAADTSGFIYASDYTYNKIYQYNISEQNFDNIWSFNLYNPNGLCFDAANNRLLIVEDTLGDIIAVDLATLAYSTIFNSDLKYTDGLTQNSDGDYLMSCWGTTSIYLIDSSFTQPEVEILSGFAGPADISYDKTTDILAVPNYLGDKVDLIQMKYKAECDTSYGKAPFEINFTGSSEDEVASWYWDFGDGNSSHLQSPTHMYTEPGSYYAKMTIITPANDTLKRQINNIFIIADTIRGGSTYGEAGQSEELIIYGNNTVPLDEIIIPIEYSGNLLLTFDSISTNGCRTNYFDLVSITHLNTFKKQLTIKLKTFPSDSLQPLLPGYGALVKVYFTFHPASSPGHNTTILLDGYDSYVASYSGKSITYSTAFLNGYVAVTIPPCCLFIRGNIDNDPLDIIDISDLVYLVDYMFTNGSDPFCFEEANVDGDVGEIVDISDLVALVDFMFTSGPDPAVCP